MNRLRQLRKAAGLTMKDLGALANLSESTISLYERGLHEPDLATVRLFADRFNVSVDYLLGRDDPASYEQLASRAQEEADLLGNEIMRQIKTLPEDTQRHLLEKWQGEVDFLKSLDK